MGNRRATHAPSDEVCHGIAIVTEEGLELEARLLAFTRDAGDALRRFDSDVERLCLDGRALERAGVRCGVAVLHAVIERMQEALAELLPDEEGLAA